MTSHNFIRAVVLGSIVLGMASCKHEEDIDPVDAQLLDLAKVTQSYTWYKGSDVLLPRSSISGHAQPLLRTRFNPIANLALDTATHKVVPDTTFPNGSIIVKELYDDANTLSLYAVLYKKPNHPYADADGWIWGYVRPDGTAKEPSRNKGAACRSCHSRDGNIDFSLMNATFP